MTIHPLLRSVCLLLATVMLVAAPSVSAQAPKKGEKAPAKPAAGKAEEKPKFKAIWEPVNFKQDIKLTDVHFVSEQVGWVTGASGTLLKTTDGGDTWTVVLGGDPAAKDEPIKTLRFAGPSHGWAVKGSGKLIRTTDGENWEEYGRMGQEYGFY